MSAFLLIVVAVLSRLLPHVGWFNFTAVGGSLLYFGARRPLSQAAWAWVPMVATDYYLTVYAYNYPFHVGGYLLTWAWYLGVILLGAWILKSRASAGRVIGAALLSSTSFFALSNFEVWAQFGSYPHTLAGLEACYVAALPFYRNDVLSTLLVSGLAFGLPTLFHRTAEATKAGRHDAAA